MQGRIGISVVAETSELRLLVEAADGLDGAAMSDPQPLDGSGEGLNFPLDGGAVIDLLEVSVLFLTSAEAMTSLVERWVKLRNKNSADEPRSGQQLLLANVKTGEVLYKGSDLEPEVLLSIVDKLPQG